MYAPLIKRTDKSPLTQWWFTVDHTMMICVGVIIFAGILFNMAASPPIAERLGIDHFHFIKRHIIHALCALITSLVLSLMAPRQIRRMSLFIFLFALSLIIYTLINGPEIKGARRWADLYFITIQPSEFIKPAFIILSAALLSQRLKYNQSIPGVPAIILTAITIGVLVLQPDFGQAILIALIWIIMLLIAGIKWRWMTLMACVASLLMVWVYIMVPHVASRIDRFVNPQSGDTYQTDQAVKAFKQGGLFGKGPGGGVVKRTLPDAHSDFIFAVIGEEFGAITLLIIVALFLFITLRGLKHAKMQIRAFHKITITAITAMIALQAIINMGVNLALLPAKGMTLPFISYGGSSLISLAFAVGVMLALSRKDPINKHPQNIHPSIQSDIL